MLVIPAIDIIDGQCVRLSQGDYSKKKVYDADPLKIAKQFCKQGAQYVHIVDLDGAKQGSTVNYGKIIEIVQALDVPVQIGGGIRDYGDVQKYLDNGVGRVILGTSAVSRPELIKKIIQNYGPERLVVSVDVRDGKVAVKGWEEMSDLSPEDFIEMLKGLGLKRIVFTDVKSDGMMKGPNFESVSNILESGLDVIVAGGVSSLENVFRLSEMGSYGAIIGKALYEGGIDFKEALKGGAEQNLAVRIVPCMDIAEGRVKKGVNFKNLQDAGDPVELGKLYSDMGADELIFLDVMATVENRDTLLDLVKRISRKINIPFTVGGGIKSVEDIRVLLNAGADKVSIGSAAVKDPGLVKAASEQFGAQCIVISVDPKRVGDGWEIYVRGGRTATGVDAIEFSKQMEELGAGELLVNSLDRDGTKEGYDIELLKTITDSVNIPVIASSGAGKKEDFVEAVKKANVDAVLAASLFHFRELEIPDLKKYLSKNNITVRL